MDLCFNIVMTGYDHTVFDSLAASNTKQRLINYADIVQGKYPQSRLVYIALRAPRGAKPFSEGHVDFIPIHCNILSIFYLLPRALIKIKNKSFILSQTPYEDGFICLTYSKLKGILCGIQVHNDLQNAPGVFPLALLRRLMSYYCFFGADIIRTVNPLAGSGLAKAYGDKVKTIPVAPSIIPNRRDTVPDTPHILIVSRFSKEKGVDAALRVVAKVSEKLPNIKITIIGDGPERDQLENLAKQLDIHPNFLGTLPPQDLAYYYSNASLLLLTSRQESWGRVLIEAILAGLPIVATSTLGAQAIIKANENGFCHPVDDIDALSQSVVRLCTDNDLNCKMGNESYKMSGLYRSQKLEHDLVETILLKLTTKELK